MAISQNLILPKCHSLKSLLPLHFSMNLSESFGINVNMDFAPTIRSRILIDASKKNLSPKSKKKGFFWILGSNQKSATAVLHVWTQNYPQNVGTCHGLPHQPLARNTFFQSDRPDPPPPPPPPPPHLK